MLTARLQQEISASVTSGPDDVSIIRKQNPDGELDNQDILDMKAAFEQDF